MQTIRDLTRQHLPPFGPTVLQSFVPVLVVVVLALLMHGLAAPSQVRLLSTVGIFVMLAVSLNIVNGFTGQFSLGHAGFMAVGAYVAGPVTYYASLHLWGAVSGDSPFLGAGQWIMLAGCLAGAVVAAIFGFLVGLPSLRLRGDYLAIVTLGFGEILRVILQQTAPQVRPDGSVVATPERVLLPLPLGGAEGFNNVPQHANLFWVYLFCGLTVLCAYRIKQSAAGRAFLSIREDEIAARAMGVNLTVYKVRAFVLAAFFAGLAGGLWAHSGVPLNPSQAGFALSFEIVIMVVLGGLGSISGVVLAATTLTVLSEFLKDQNPPGIMQILTSWASNVGSPSQWPWLLIVWLGMAVIATLTTQRKWVPWVILVCVGCGWEALRHLALALDLRLADYRLIIYALLLVLTMILRPKGLMGVNEIWELFRTARRSPTPVKQAVAVPVSAPPGTPEAKANEALARQELDPDRERGAM